MKTAVTSLFILICILLGASSVWSYKTFLEMEEESARIVEDAIPVAIAAKGLLTEVLNQDTAIRGYVVTSDPSFLMPYDLGKEKLSRHLAVIQSFEDQHPVMKQLVNEEARPAIDQLQLYFAEQIRLVDSGNRLEAERWVYEEKQLMDEFRLIAQWIEEDVKTIIERTSVESSQAAERARMMILLTTTVSFLAAFALVLSLFINRRLSALSSIDSLTELHNRRMLDAALKKEWRKAKRLQRPIGLLLIDIDAFKVYNDTYGHVQGDHCLKIVADAISNGTPDDGFSARYGGEEFAVLLPGYTVQEAVDVAEQIRMNIEKASIPHKSSPFASVVTASIGVYACKPSWRESLLVFIEQTDQSLYLAKQKGRNQVVASGE